MKSCILTAIFTLGVCGSAVAETAKDLQAENARLREAVRLLWPQDWAPWNGKITKKNIKALNERAHPERNWKYIPTKSLAQVQEEGKELARKNIAEYQAEIKWLESDERGLRPKDRERIEQLRGWIAEDQDTLDGKPFGVN